MVNRLARFNLILLLVAALTTLTGCQTPKEEKLETYIRIHLEVNSNVPQSKEVPIYRARPVLVNVQNEPFLTEVGDGEGDALGLFAGELAAEEEEDDEAHDHVDEGRDVDVIGAHGFEGSSTH